MLQPVAHMARTILVVDDEPTQREMLAEALEAEGFTIVTAADGRAALLKFREGEAGPRPARPDAARDVRDRGLPDHPGRIGRADPDADGQELGARQGRRPRARRGRLRDEAVQPARADRPGSGPVPADRAAGVHRRPPSRGRRRRRPASTSPATACCATGSPCRSSRRRSSSSPSSSATRARSSPATSSSSTSGATTTPARRGPSTSTSIGSRSRIEDDPANPEFLHTVRGTGYVFRRPRPDRASARRYPCPHAPERALLRDPP